MRPYPPLSLATLSLLFAGQVFAADDDIHALLKQMSKQMADLKQQSAQSNARIRELEQTLVKEQSKNRSAPALEAAAPSEVVKAPVKTPAPTVVEAKKEVKPAVTLGDAKGTFKIPGTNTSLGFGGFVKLDMVENSVSSSYANANTLDYRMSGTQIPLASQRYNEDSQTSFNARESRLWFKSFTPSEWGNIDTYLEMDLFGSPSGNYSPRLRHAYGTWGNFTAGQTWTTFLNTLALADTLDSNNGVGVTLVRQPLARWSQPFKISDQSFEFQAAVEAPDSRLLVGNSAASKNTNDTTFANMTFTNPDSNRYPDLVGRLNYKANWGNVSLAGMGRQVRYMNNQTPANVNTPAKTGYLQEAWGAAVSLAGRVDLFDQDNLRFALNYGDALGRYLTHPMEDASLMNEKDNQMKLTTAYSTTVSYQHWWHKQWRSNFVYGYEGANRPGYTNSWMTDHAQSVHANLLWNPLPQAMLGIEYIYGTRETVDGRSGNLNRAFLSAKYSF